MARDSSGGCGCGTILIVFLLFAILIEISNNQYEVVAQGIFERQERVGTSLTVYFRGDDSYTLNNYEGSITVTPGVMIKILKLEGRDKYKIELIQPNQSNGN